jgi:hypothetical protein
LVGTWTVEFDQNSHARRFYGRAKPPQLLNGEFDLARPAAAAARNGVPFQGTDPKTLIPRASDPLASRCWRSFPCCLQDPSKLSAYRDRRFKGTQEEYEAALLASTTLYIGNMSFYTTEEQAYELFSRAGEIKKIIMGLDKNSKTPCGFCFVLCGPLPFLDTSR